MQLTKRAEHVSINVLTRPEERASWTWIISVAAVHAHVYIAILLIRLMKMLQRYRAVATRAMCGRLCSASRVRPFPACARQCEASTESSFSQYWTDDPATGHQRTERIWSCLLCARRDGEEVLLLFDV